MVIGQLSRLEARHPVASAAEAGQEEAVQALIEMESSPDNRGSRKRGYSGYTPLMFAAGERAESCMGRCPRCGRSQHPQ